MSCYAYIIFLLVINLQLVFGIKDGLYSTEDDDVVPLNHESFAAQVLKVNSDVIWIVEFYNSWCGHCIHFAPSWKEIAVGFKDWRDLVVIAAIDCSQSVNLESCRKYDISSYPTLKMFPPTSSSDDKVETIHTQLLQSIKKSILDFMVKNAPASWPRLQPLAKIEDIWHEKKDFHEHVILIFEEEDSPVGAQVIIDLRNTQKVLVRRMLKDNVAKYGITKFPSLYKVGPDSTYSILAIGNKMMADDRVAFVQKIKVLAGDTGVANPQGFTENGKSPLPGFNDELQDSNLELPEKYNSSVVSMQDLESALHYSFRQEVAIKKVINDDKLYALRGFVGVLLKYFPGRKPVVGFLNRVNEMLVSLGSDQITGEEWVQKLSSLQDKDNYLPEVEKWDSCQGSSPRYRGYPCAMWTLFHTLTVAAYNQNVGARHSNPQDVLVAVRGYMKHFFGCQECSKNFLLMAQSIEEEVHKHRDSVLWLWSAHNKANKRLKGDVSEDPEHPKVEFPTDKICPQCHIVKSVDSGIQISWDTEKVLDFLVGYYSETSIVPSRDIKDVHDVAAKNIISSVEKKEIDWWEKNLPENDLQQLEQLREKRVKKNIKIIGDRNYEPMKSKHEGYQVLRLWGLTHIDFSLCITFYLISTVIILTLYHHFIVRRRMLPCKNITSQLPL